MHEHRVYPGAGLAPALQYDGEHGDVADGRDHHEYAVRDDGDQVALVEPQVVRQRRLVEHGRVGHVVQVDVHLAPRRLVVRVGGRLQRGLNVRVHQVHRHDEGCGGGGGGGVGGDYVPEGRRRTDIRVPKVRRVRSFAIPATLVDSSSEVSPAGCRRHSAFKADYLKGK